MTKKRAQERKVTTSIGVSPHTKRLFRNLKLAVSNERKQPVSEDELVLELLRQEAPKHGVEIPNETTGSETREREPSGEAKNG